MSHPKYLSLLKERAQIHINNDDGISAFLISWVLWESTRTRLLILQYRQHGYTVKDARNMLFNKKISGNKGFEKLYKSIGKTSWEDSLDQEIKKNWLKIKNIQNIRHQLVHGGRSYYEGTLLKYSKVVLGFVESLNSHPLGDPLQKLKG